jgi:hypothetical protein
MFHPDRQVAIGAAAVVAPATIQGTFRHRPIARPKSQLEPKVAGEIREGFLG